MIDTSEVSIHKRKGNVNITKGCKRVTSEEEREEKRNGRNGSPLRESRGDEIEVRRRERDRPREIEDGGWVVYMYVYAIKSRVDGRIYVGMTADIEK